MDQLVYKTLYKTPSLMLTHFLYFWNQDDDGDPHHDHTVIGSDEEAGGVVVQFGGRRKNHGWAKARSFPPACFKPTKAYQHYTTLQYHTNLPDNISTTQCQWSHKSALISIMSCGERAGIVICIVYCSIVRVQYSGVIYSGVDHVLWYCGLREDGIGIGRGCREEATHCSNATKL